MKVAPIATKLRPRPEAMTALIHTGQHYEGPMSDAFFADLELPDGRAHTPAGINCGKTCSATYPSGTAVTLMATPGAGFSFSGWSGACTGTGSCAVSMTTAQPVTATFRNMQG